MSRRDSDTGQALFAVLFSALAVAASFTLVTALAAHSVIAAVWALLATLTAGWLGFLHLGRVHEDRTRALREADREPLPAPPERPSVAEVITGHRLGRRIGDAERDIVVAALHTHYAAGRLDAAELDERIGQALAARTIDDLILAVRDLPSEVTGR